MSKVAEMGPHDVSGAVDSIAAALVELGELLTTGAVVIAASRSAREHARAVVEDAKTLRWRVPPRRA